MEDQDPVYADVVLTFFDSGTGPIPGPYGGTNPGDYPVPVSTSVVLGPDGSPVDFLSLPTGSFVIVGFTSATILDGPGDDIFIQEVGTGGEEAQVFVSSNGTDFVLLGIANDASQTSFDLASIGFTDPVTAVKIVGLDNGGDSPGFDVVNVQGLPGSFNLAPVANPDEATTDLETAVVIPVLANDTDPDGDAFGLESVGQPANGTATIEGASVRYTPARGFSGTDSFTYVVKDARGATATGTVTVEVGAPDIVATIAAGSTTWVAGDFVPITVTVTNTSDVEITDGFGVEIVLSTDAVIDDGDAILNFESIPGLAARGSDLATYDLRVDGLFENGFMPGTYFLGVFADNFEEIDEDNEANNKDLLQVELATDEPDLVVTSFSLDDTDWEAGETIGFSGTVTNSGGGDVESFFGDFAVSIYLSADMAIGLGDLLLAEGFLPDLDAGASAGFSGTFPVDSIFPDAIGGGTYYVGAYADDYFEVDESQEGNNASVPVEVTIGKPDLVFEGFAVDDTDWRVGDTITVSGRIRNIGDVEIKSGEDRFLWGIGLGTSAAFADLTEDRAIPPGGSIDVAQSFVFTDALARQFPPGSYALVGIVDTGGAIDEESEANNVSASRTITISENELDYTVANFAIGTQTPRLDQPVTFTFDVDNLGPDDGEQNVFVEVFASPDPTVTADDHLVTLELFAGGLPASPGPQQVTLTAPFDVLRPGRYYVGAIVDAKGEVDETNEANNVSNIVQVTVPATIFLDFDHPIPKSFLSIPNPFNGSTIDIPVPGTSPLSNFRADQKSDLVRLTQDIFNRSGVDVFVTQTEPATGPYHSVRFTPPLSPTSATLGIAYEGIDQFDRLNRNIVAIFQDQLSTVGRSVGLVAEDIAHEIGHALGLIHINPLRNNGVEVMDYDTSSVSRFFNGVAQRFEPPTDANTSPIFTGTTHNPTYHLRRYVNGVPDAELRAAGITPGNWDDPSFARNVWFTITLGALRTEIDRLFLARIDGTVEGPGAGDPAPRLTLLGEDVAAGDTLSFRMAAGTPFMLMGTTPDGGALDIRFSFSIDGAATAELVAAEDLVVSADIRMFTGEGAPTVSVGTAALQEIRTEPFLPDPGAPAPTEGDDRLENLFGDEDLDALGGRDSFVYLYTRSAVEERVAGDGAVEVRSIEGEFDRLASVERIELFDGTYIYDLPGDDVPFTYRLYSAALARLPDEPGLRFWNDRRVDGLSDRNMSRAFVDSPEFALKFGEDPTDEEYIQALYRNVLLRDADAAGEAFWVDAFASGALDRYDMLIAFSESVENRERNEDNYDDGVWVI